MHRNQLKRLAREIFRKFRSQLPPGDYLLYFKGLGELGGARALRPELVRAFEELARRGPANVGNSTMAGRPRR